MRQNKSFLVFIRKEATCFLCVLSYFIETDEASNASYISCSEINEDSHHFLKIIISLKPKNKANAKELKVEIFLPYQYILWVFSAPPEGLQQALGFRSSHPGSKTEK